jgi:hypothetical protein
MLLGPPRLPVNPITIFQPGILAAQAHKNSLPRTIASQAKRKKIGK